MPSHQEMMIKQFIPVPQMAMTHYHSISLSLPLSPTLSHSLSLFLSLSHTHTQILTHTHTRRERDFISAPLTSVLFHTPLSVKALNPLITPGVFQPAAGLRSLKEK